VNATDWAILVLRPLLPVLATLMLVPIILWVERRGAGLMQDRPGPNRVGFFGWHAFGLGQPLADALKFFFKEDVTPDHVDAFLYTISPWIVMFSALVGFAVIPYGSSIPIAGRVVPLVGADVPIGALFIFAMAGLSVYGIVLAGWSSNNKYSLMGGLRSAAQVISYELAMTTAGAGVFLASASLRLTRVVAAQQSSILRWNVVPQFFGFIVFTISAFAETNRVPFDLAEPDSVAALFDTAAAIYGGVDASFNVGADMAALMGDSDVVDIELDLWDRVMAVNLRGYVVALKSAIPLMLARGGGAIVNMSSAAAFQGEPTRPAYATAKAGIGALTRHVAARWGKQGIRCNAVAPGFTATQAIRSVPQWPELEAAALKRMRGNRVGDTEDIASLVAFLISLEGEWINGQVINIDGGTVLR